MEGDPFAWLSRIDPQDTHCNWYRIWGKAICPGPYYRSWTRFRGQVSSFFRGFFPNGTIYFVQAYLARSGGQPSNCLNGPPPAVLNVEPDNRAKPTGRGVPFHTVRKRHLRRLVAYVQNSSPPQKLESRTQKDM